MEFGCCMMRENEQSNPYINGLMEKRHNSGALALDLHIFCIKPSIYTLEVRLFGHIGAKLGWQNQ